MKALPAGGIVGIVALVEAASGEYRQIIELVQAALMKKLGLDPMRDYCNIEAIFADRVILRRDGRFQSYTYTLGADNVVTLGDAQEVVEEYVPVKLREALDATQFLEAKDGEGKVWDVAIIRAGQSKNKVTYPAAVLREAAPLFEGVRSFAKPDEVHIKGQGKDVNLIAGWIEGVKFVEGATPAQGYLGGTFTFAGGASKLRETVTDAWKRGKRDLVGFSIDATGLMKKGAQKICESITKVNSVDLIVEASAGGGLLRLVEAANPDEEQKDMKLRERMLKLIEAKRPELYAKVTDETGDDVLEAYYREALAVPAAAAGGLTQADVDKQIRMVEARANMRATIGGSKLPEAAQTKLIEGFAARAEFTDADVAKAIKDERTYLAHFTESGKVKLNDAGDIVVEDRPAKMAAMFDAFFDPAHKDHRATQSFKECYIEITGDKRVTGRLEHCDQARLRESVAGAFRESLDSASFAYVLGDSVTRRMVAEFRGAVEFDAWRKIASVVPVQDFRTQDRTLFGGYGDLPAVVQGAAYTALASPTDQQATYAVTKRGGTEDVTLEMIKNDDVGSIRRIPVKLGRAAKRTLSKFVFDFIRSNPVIYDGVAFFHANHGNLGSTAFSDTEYSVVRLAMMKQVELSSSDRLGIGPSMILCPVDLEKAASDAFRRSTNLDETFVQSLKPTIIPVWYWTDATDWAAACNPADVPGIEVGFLDGQEEPELFVQDAPNQGSMFSNDKITYKIRHIYGGNVLPGGERAFYKEVVAG